MLEIIKSQDNAIVLCNTLLYSVTKEFLDRGGHLIGFKSKNNKYSCV